MDTQTTNTSAGVQNISTADLAGRLAQRMNASAAPAPTASPAPTTPTAEQPTAGAPGPDSQDQAPAPEQPSAPELAAPEAPQPETPEATAPTEDPEAAPQDPPTEPEAEAGEDDESLPADDRGKVKRIHKLLGERKALREENERLAQQNQQLAQAVQEARKGGTPRQDSFSGHPQVKDVDGRLQLAMQTLDWCEANAQGGEMAGPNGQTFTFSAEDVAKMRRQADNDRVALVAERSTKVAGLQQQQQQIRAAADQKARTVYPWLTNQQSPEFAVVVKIANQIPGVMDSPEMLLVLGDAARGRMLREAEERKPRTPAARPPAREPLNVTTTPAAAPKVDPRAAALTTAEAEYRKSPTLANYQKLTQARTQAAGR